MSAYKSLILLVGDIVRNRNASSAQLIGEPEPFRSWEGRCEPVDFQTHLDCPLPHHEIFERFVHFLAAHFLQSRYNRRHLKEKNSSK